MKKNQKTKYVCKNCGYEFGHAIGCMVSERVEVKA